MKDAKGHGSEGRSGAQADDKTAANALANGHPKSAPVPIHGGAAGRDDKIAAWRDQGTSDSQAREGIRAMFNLPSKE